MLISITYSRLPSVAASSLAIKSSILLSLPTKWGVEASSVDVAAAGPGFANVWTEGCCVAHLPCLIKHRCYPLRHRTNVRTTFGRAEGEVASAVGAVVVGGGEP